MLSSDPHEFQTQAIEVGRNLSAEWRQYWAKSQQLNSDHLPDSSLAVIAGLAAHVDKLAEHGFDLIEQGEWLVAMPIIRSAYECAIRAQWIQQVPDAGVNFLAEDTRQMRNLSDTLGNAKSQTMQETAEKMAHRIVEDFGRPSDQARRFNEACNDLEAGGVDSYVYYKAMSNLCHPSVLLVEQYIEERGDSIHLLDAAKPDGGSAWAGFLSASLVWATAVVEFNARDRDFRSAVRRAATTLSVPFVMHMSKGARKRNT